MTDRTHLAALRVRLSNERQRHSDATGQERELRAVWIQQVEREIEAEKRFLGIEESEEIPADVAAMNDDELLTELLGETVGSDGRKGIWL